MAPVRGRERGDTFSGLTLLTSQKWWFLVAKRVAPAGGMERGKFLSLRSRERGALFSRARFACLSKVVVLFAKVFASVGS